MTLQIMLASIIFTIGCFILLSTFLYLTTEYKKSNTKTLDTVSAIAGVAISLALMYIAFK